MERGDCVSHLVSEAQTHFRQLDVIATTARNLWNDCEIEDDRG